MKDYITISLVIIGIILICIACFCIHYIVGLIFSGLLCLFIASSRIYSKE